MQDMRQNKIWFICVIFMLFGYALHHVVPGHAILDTEGPGIGILWIYIVSYQKVRGESERGGLKGERWKWEGRIEKWEGKVRGRVDKWEGKVRGGDKRQNLLLLWTHAWRPSHHRRSYERSKNDGLSSPEGLI